MKSLALVLQSRRKATYQKLKARFVKSLETGRITEKTNRDKYRVVNKLKQIERQLGIRSTLKLRHWALAAAIGLVTTATAFKNNDKEARWSSEENRRTELNLEEFRPAVFMPVGDTGVNLLPGPFLSEKISSEMIATQDFDGDGDLDLVSFSESNYHSIWFNDGTGSLQNRTELPGSTGVEVRDIVIDTVDADGDYDILLVENYYPGTGGRIQLLENDGTGSFTSTTLFIHNYQIEEIQTGDIDGNGDLDILMRDSDGTTNNFILLDNNNQTFTPGTLNIYSGFIPFYNNERPQLADLDGDGDLDIFISPTNRFDVNYDPNGDRHGFQALLNDGTGYFNATQTSQFYNYYVGTFQGDPQLIDVDGDGQLDVVLQVNDGTSSVGFFENLGAASFADPVRLNVNTGDYIQNFWLGDFDDDADQDVVVEVNSSLGSIKSKYRTFAFDAGSFGVELDSLQPTLNGFDELVTGDFDGDGDDDVISSNYFRLTHFEMEAGEFTLFREIIDPVVALGFEVVDLDGDGDLDIVGNYLAQVLVNDGMGGFSLSQTLADSLGHTAEGVAVGDFDSDGDMDIVLLSGYYQVFDTQSQTFNFYIHPFTNDGNGVFTPLPKVHITGDSFGYVGGIDFMALGDTDGDSDLELHLLVAGDGQRLQSHDFNGSNFDGVPFFEYGYSSAIGDVRDLIIFDVDGDLANDMVFATDGNGVSVLQNMDGTGTSFENRNASPELPVLSGYGISKLDTADIDGDGDTDMLLVSSNFPDVGGYHHIAYNDSETTAFTWVLNNSGLYTNVGSSSGALADFDNDGDLDIITAGYYTNDIIFENDGAGAFVEVTPSSYYASWGLNVGDLDGDGDVDIISSQVNTGSPRVLFNGLVEPNFAPVVEDQAFDIPENIENGEAAGTIAATDPEGGALSFSITSGNEDGIFALDAGTGAITVVDTTTIDFETTTSYILVVEVSDGNTPVSATITINVTDINETPVATDQVFRVDQDAAIGTVVGTIPAVDPENDPLTFTIESGDPDGAFTIASPSGEVTVLDNSAIDYETQADYTLEVSVSDGELTDNASVQIRVTTLARDQAVLLAFFDATGGTSWTQSDNWSDANTISSDWSGITVTDGRVTEIVLPGNEITGAVPESFADLTGLTNVDLSDNEITSFPDVSFFPDLATLNLQNNKLGIQDLLDNSDGTFTYDYAPQKPFGTAEQDTIRAGADFTLSIPELNGFDADYSWSLGESVAGTGQTYDIINADFAQMGDYSLTVSQITGLEGLMLTTEPWTIYAATDVFGQVIADQETETLLTSGQVNIYRIFDGPFELTDSATLDATTGEYLIDDVVLGNFILLVQNDVDAFPNVLQTYYVSTNDWVEADTLFLLEEAQGIDILMQRKPFPDDLDPEGAQLTGLVETNFAEDDDENGRIEARRKVKKAGCSLRRRTRSGGGRTGQEDEYELYAYVESDDEGQFSFAEIPPGEYLINIQYPGVPMDTTSQITFTVGEEFEKQKFELSATITEEGIDVRIDEVLSVKKPFIRDVELYPNPTDGKLLADFTISRRIADLKLEVVDLQGLKLSEQALDHQMGPQRVEIDLSELGSGVYFLVLTDEAQSFRYVMKVGKK